MSNFNDLHGTDTDLHPVPGWQGGRRSDGMMVLRIGDTWRVISPDERPMLRACPCCGVALGSAKAAKKVANAVYPPDGTRRDTPAPAR